MEPGETILNKCNVMSYFTFVKSLIVSFSVFFFVDNKLSKLPSEVAELCSLRSLNISANKITKLPRALCRVRTLETLSLDTGSMHYPHKDVCSQGIEAIMKFICAGLFLSS